MPTQPTYPGVYVEELPSKVRTVIGLSTSITAFVGRALRGPTNKALTILTFADYVRIFGGFWKESNMSYAVYHYFLNGGDQAIITRVHRNATAAIFERDDNKLQLKASNTGSWGKNLHITVNHNVDKNLKKANTLFNLSIKDTKTSVNETFRNLSVEPEDSRFIVNVLKEDSNLVQVEGEAPSTRPPEDDNRKPKFVCKTDSGNDGEPLTPEEIIGNPSSKTGIYAMDNIDLFNLLCIPTFHENDNTDSRISAYKEAVKYFAKKGVQFCSLTRQKSGQAKTRLRKEWKHSILTPAKTLQFTFLGSRLQIQTKDVKCGSLFLVERLPE
jgi:hypothetical protein